MIDNRSNPSFRKAQVSKILPEFFLEDYPQLVLFLEKYYEHTAEDDSVTFEKKIHNLFDIRDISTTELETLDLLIGEISDGLNSSSFYQSPRLIARLLSQFYRSKGTQVSTEQFFKAFFDEEVEVSYPKKDIFILNDRPGGSLIGPQSLHYIQDDKKYQIFSILLKTGMSLSDYETLYKKMVHPAGFYLAAETETQSSSDIELMAGVTTDPLEVPNYPVVLETSQHGSLTPVYSLLTMEENDPVDARTQAQKDGGTGIVVSSLETLDKYENITLQQIVDDFNNEVSEWVGVKSPTLDDGILDLSQDYETLDAGDHT